MTGDDDHYGTISRFPETLETDARHHTSGGPESHLEDEDVEDDVSSNLRTQESTVRKRQR